jgi:hypothetical protein
MTPVILSAHTPVRLRFTKKANRKRGILAFTRGYAAHSRLEQPCLENLHPYGDEWLFRHTPGDWQIVVTAIPETMRRRAAATGFRPGLQR